MKIYAKTILSELIRQSGLDPLDFIDEYKADLLVRKEKHYNANEIIEQLVILCNTSGIILQQHSESKEQLLEILKSAAYPVLLFIKENNSDIPVIIKKVDNKSTYVACRTIDNQIEETLFENITDFFSDNTLLDDNKHIHYITVYPVRPFESNEIEQKNNNHNRYKILSKFFNLLLEERREIVYVWLYAIISGIVTLSLPLGIQSLINFVSSGQAVTSAYILILFILIGIFGTGFITIMQLQLVEYIRQRVFVKNTFQYAYIIPKIKLESILKYNPPELINRFFDVVSLQKGLATLLIDFSSALLQIVFGIILLTMYHPFFIIIGIFLITALILIISLTGPKGLETSINESTYKYKIANWLEEMARALSTFKLAGNTTFAQDKTDTLLSKYLYWRNKHFKILVSQYYSFVIFKTLITAILLLLGVYLIVNQLITLGQFVASEIIIILIMNSIEKIIIKLDTVYDVLTSTEKLSTVKQLPIDNYNGIEFPSAIADNGIQIEVKDLSYHYQDSDKKVLDRVSFVINPGDRICISGENGCGKTTLVNILLGIYENYEGMVMYNGLSLRTINKLSLFDHLGDYISQQGIFDGTLIENIIIGRKNISISDVQWALDVVGLSDWVNSLPNGFDTMIIGGSVRLSSGIEKRIVLARNMVDKPKVLVLDDFLLGVSRKDKVNIMQSLSASAYQWSLILISNDPVVMHYCKRIILMQDGKLIADSDFKSLEAGNEYFRDIVFNKNV